MSCIYIYILIISCWILGVRRCSLRLIDNERIDIGRFRKSPMDDEGARLRAEKSKDRSRKKPAPGWWVKYINARLSYMYVICDISIHGSQSEMCIKNPCELCWIHWSFDIVIHRVLEHSGMLRFRKLWAHPGSRPDFTRKSRMKWWACGACPFAEYGADSFLSWAWLGSVFTRFAQNWISTTACCFMLVCLDCRCWFTWGILWFYPSERFWHISSRRFLCWTRCRCEICRNELRDAHSRYVIGTIWEWCHAPSQIRIHLEPTMANYNQPQITSRSIFPFCSCPATKKRSVFTFGGPTQEVIAKLMRSYIYNLYI